MENRFYIGNSSFDETTGISTVTIKTKIGTFTGSSYLQDEDKENISRFAGCRLAELKAIRKYYIELIKRLKLEARGMKQICDAIDTSIKITNNYELTPAAKIAKRNYNKKLQEIEAIKQKIKAYTNYIKYSIQTRDEYIKKQKDKTE